MQSTPAYRPWHRHDDDDDDEVSLRDNLKNANCLKLARERGIRVVSAFEKGICSFDYGMHDKFSRYTSVCRGISETRIPSDVTGYG
jgi:hypothetical protein